MKIQSFIFNWRNQLESTLVIEKQLNKILDQVNVINSDENNSQSHWLNVGENCYFTAQFLKAIELHDRKSIFFHVQGDTSYTNWTQLTKDACHYMQKYNAGIYYPKVKNVEWYDDDITEVEGVEFIDENLKMIANGDETVWFIDPRVINYFKDHNFDQFFACNRFGWGFDIVMCAISYILGLPVIRDANHTIEHPLQTNYNKQQAQEQYNQTKRKLPQEIKQYIHHTLDTGERFRFLNYLDI